MPPEATKQEQDLKDEVRRLGQRFKKLEEEDLLPGPSFSETVRTRIRELTERGFNLLSWEVAELRGMVLVLEERAAKIRRKLRSE